jgi:transcriptional regulator with XRE-family HTH domain
LPLDRLAGKLRLAGVAALRSEIRLTRFPENLALVLKLMSLSSAALAARLQTDKSVVSRWLKGRALPSAHNLARLSTLVATYKAGFNTLDWDREPASLAVLLGADPQALGTADRDPADGLPAGLPLALLTQLSSASDARGAAYEGFFRSTRPHPRATGRFIHEWGMIRREGPGPLRLRMGSAETAIIGWMMPLNGLVYSVGEDTANGAMMFGIFNGLGASRVDVFDGLTLVPAADKGRAPMATAIICERIGDLTKDSLADDRKLAELTRQNPLAPEGSIDPAMAAHLASDFGPACAAAGGEWLLSMSLTRSLSRGPAYESQQRE